MSLGYLEYISKVNDVITEEFRKEIGANPIKGSSLEIRIAKASKNFATIARRLFKTKGRNYNRSTAQHFFKIKTHIPLREKKARRNESPDSAPMSSSSGPNAAPNSSSGPEAAHISGLDTNTTPGPSKSQKKPFEECGRTEKHNRVKKLKASAGGDAELVLSTAKSVAKDLDLNRHFVFKKMEQDPNLAADLKRYIENDLSMFILNARVLCLYKYKY